MIKQSGIYKITCLKTNKIYIGSSIDIKKRWNSHRHHLRNGIHGNNYLQNSWNKYGEKNFKFEIIEIIKPKLLMKNELRWFKKTKCCNLKFGFNIGKNPNAPMLGRKHSKKSKLKISTALIGKKLIDLTGKKFGRLTVKEKSNNDQNGRSRWLCLCDCGEEKIIYGHSLGNNHTNSCGCLNKEIVSQIGKLNKRHGHTNKNSRTYRAWTGMRDRCNNKNNQRYEDYRGRGITVCKRWSNKKNGFENFLEDVGEIPKGKDFCRIRINGDYNPNNWKLSTREEQSKNKRSTVLITFNNRTLCLKDWSVELNIKYDTLWARIRQYKWSIKRAFTTHVGAGKCK
jgi:group I intron endonuclease